MAQAEKSLADGSQVGFDGSPHFQTIFSFLFRYFFSRCL